MDDEIAKDAIMLLQRQERRDAETSRAALKQKLEAISAGTQRGLQTMRRRRLEIEQSLSTVERLLHSVSDIKRDASRIENSLPSIVAESDAAFASIESMSPPRRSRGGDGGGVGGGNRLPPMPARPTAQEGAPWQANKGQRGQQRPHVLDELQDALDARQLGFDGLLRACGVGKDGVISPNQFHDALSDMRLDLNRRQVSAVIALLNSGASGGGGSGERRSGLLCLFDLRRELRRRARARARRAHGGAKKRKRRRRKRATKNTPAPRMPSFGRDPRGGRNPQRMPAGRRRPGQVTSSSIEFGPRGGARADVLILDDAPGAAALPAAAAPALALNGRMGSSGGDGTRAMDPLEAQLEKLAQTAALLEETGRPAEAEPYREEILAMRDRQLGPAHPDTLAAANNLALVLSEQNKLDEAEPLYRGALAGFEKVIGASHPSTLTLLNNIAMLLRQQDRLDEAEPFLRRALAGSEQTLGPHHQHTLQAVNNLASLLHDSDKLEEAEPLLRQALDSHSKTLGDSHPDTHMLANNLADLLRDVGKFDEAEMLMRSVLSGLESILGTEHPNTQIARENLEDLLEARSGANASGLPPQAVVQRRPASQ
eukprot:g4168.t1